MIAVYQRPVVRTTTTEVTITINARPKKRCKSVQRPPDDWCRGRKYSLQIKDSFSSQNTNRLLNDSLPGQKGHSPWTKGISTTGFFSRFFSPNGWWPVSIRFSEGVVGVCLRSKPFEEFPVWGIFCFWLMVIMQPVGIGRQKTSIYQPPVPCLI